jgi:hypothetical protein
MAGHDLNHLFCGNLKRIASPGGGLIVMVKSLRRNDDPGSGTLSFLGFLEKT